LDVTLTEQLSPKSLNETYPIVLLVDDNPANLHLLVETLIQENYRVLVAESGESALARVRYAQPDIILLDVVMPGISGFETCRRLKANPATSAIPILFLSALDDTVDKVEGLQVGGVDYITKPVQVIEVLARMRTHLLLRQSQQRLARYNEDLEERVTVRTAQLQTELERRKQHEAEIQKLLEILTTQSDQLRRLTTFLIQNHQQQRAHVAHNMTTHIRQRLQQVTQQLTILGALAGTIENSTARYQVTTQLQQLSADISALAADLQLATAELQQPSPAAQCALNNPLLKLTAREHEVLQLLVDGKAAAQIAELLCVSEATVRGYRSRLLQKLELEDTTALIKFAVQHKLISL
jgi:DNA-binding response OmpR family regulator/DNA-binding CsgD family transcriptional regulator